MFLKRSKELENKLVDLISEGKTTKEIAELIGVSVSAINRWKDEDIDLDDACTRARRRALQLHVEQMRDVAENMSDVQRARLICDNTKWEAARIAPDKYGDRIEVNVNKTTDIRGALAEAESRLLLRCSQAKLVESQVTDINDESTNSAGASETLVQSETSDPLTKVPDEIPPDFLD